MLREKKLIHEWKPAKAISMMIAMWMDLIWPFLHRNSEIPHVAPGLLPIWNKSV
jgi:hypothetical protein